MNLLLSMSEPKKEFKGHQRTYILDSVGRWKIMNIYEHTIHWLTFIKTSPSKVFTLEFMIFLLVFCSGPSSCFRTVRNAPRSQTTTLVSFLGNELQTSCRTRAAASNPNISFPATVMGLGTNLTEVIQQTLEKVRTNLGFVPAKKKTQAKSTPKWSAMVCFNLLRDLRSSFWHTQILPMACPSSNSSIILAVGVPTGRKRSSHPAAVAFCSMGVFIPKRKDPSMKVEAHCCTKRALAWYKSPRISPVSEKQHLWWMWFWWTWNFLWRHKLPTRPGSKMASGLRASNLEWTVKAHAPADVLGDQNPGTWPCSLHAQNEISRLLLFSSSKSCSSSPTHSWAVWGFDPRPPAEFQWPSHPIPSTSNKSCPWRHQNSEHKIVQKYSCIPSGNLLHSYWKWP